MDQDWDTSYSNRFRSAMYDADPEQVLLSSAIEYSLEQLQLDMDRALAESIVDAWQEEIKSNYYAATKNVPETAKQEEWETSSQ